MKHAPKTRKETLSIDLQRADCLEAHCPKAVFHVEAKPIKAPDAVKMLRQHAAMIQEAAAARAKWLQLVADERVLGEKLKPIVVVAAHYVTNMFGTGSPAYIDFGLADTSAAKPTVETKAHALRKAAATRTARHTMGKKARLKLRGEADTSHGGSGNSASNGAVAPTAITNAGGSAPAVGNGQAH